MKQRLRTALKMTLGFIVAVICSGLILGVWLHHKEQTDFARFEEYKQSLENQLRVHLPPGTSKLQVIQFFRAHQMDYSQAPIEEYRRGFYPLQELPSSSRLAMWGLTPRMPTSFLIVCQIQVSVGLDQNDRVSGFKSKEVCTGP